MRHRGLLAALLIASTACGNADEYDVIIRRGTIYDGTGGPPVEADLAINGDSIVAIGQLDGARALVDLDATGLVVAVPAYIFHRYFRSRVSGLVVVMEKEAIALLDELAAQQQPDPNAAAPNVAVRAVRPGATA